MADAQQIVDRIRTFLAANDQTRCPELVAMASSYAALCRQTNERLGRCADYLRRGLRSEAIQLADDPPPLADIVATLAFPELPDWERICVLYDLARPAGLLADCARR